MLIYILLLLSSWRDKYMITLKSNLFLKFILIAKLQPPTLELISNSSSSSSTEISKLAETARFDGRLLEVRNISLIILMKGLGESD